MGSRVRVVPPRCEGRTLLSAGVLVTLVLLLAALFPPGAPLSASRGHPLAKATDLPASSTLPGASARVSAGGSSGLTFPIHVLPSVRNGPSSPERSATSGRPALNEGTPVSPLLPATFRATYGVDALLNSSGKGPSFPRNESIGVISWGYGYVPQDLQSFFSTYYPSSFPQPKIIPVPIDGASPPGINAASDPSGGSLELTVDIEWAASMAPGATIYAIYAPPGPESNGFSPSDQSIEDAIQYAVDLGNLTALSLSFGEPQGSDAPLEATMEEEFQNLTKNGTTVLAASGDDGGSADSAVGHPCTTGPLVDFPAASPLVLSVGGTNATGLGQETAWSLSGGGSASTSAGDPDPSWQTLGSAGAFAAATGTRQVPDVAGTAVDNGFYFGSTFSSAYGTSFASPLWAGIVADLASADHTHFGALAGELYALGALHEATGSSPAPFVGVTQGGNCYYSAEPGWNRVTGWGTPEALVLAQELASDSFQSLSVSATPSRGVSAGTRVFLNVSLPTGASSELAGRPLTVYVLSPSNDSWTLELAGTVPGPGGPSWQGNFLLPAALANIWVNLTAVAENGTVWGLGSTTLGPPPQPTPSSSGPSLLELLTDYELPILSGFLLLFLAFRFLGDRRRQAVAGPTPRELSGAPPAAGASAGPTVGEPSPAGRTGPPAGTASPSPEFTPFCWRCGATLSGKEVQCPSCGTRFS